MDISEIRKGQKIYLQFGSGIYKWKILSYSDNNVVLDNGLFGLGIIMVSKKDIVENGVLA